MTRTALYLGLFGKLLDCITHHLFQFHDTIYDDTNLGIIHVISILLPRLVQHEIEINDKYA